MTGSADAGQALAALPEAERRFPGRDLVTLFLDQALTSARRGEEAVARLITLALDRINTDDLAYYQRARRQYAAAP